MEQHTEGFEKKTKITKRLYFGLYSLLVLIGLSVSIFVLLYIAQQKLVALGEIRFQANLLAGQLRQSSDDLTRLVRTYAATGNKKFEQQFYDVLAIRDGKKPRPIHYDRIYWDFLSVENGKPPYPSGKAVSLKELMKEAGFTEREFSLLAASQKESNQLVELEQTAMNAMKGITTGEFEEIPNDTSGQQVAIKILFGERYHQSKTDIMQYINMFLEELENRTSAEFSHQASRFQVFLFSEISTFALIICIVAFLIRTSKQYHTGRLSILKTTIKDRATELSIINERLVRKESFAVIGRISGSIAHDIRHPLATIKNSAYFLNKTLKEPDEKTKKHLKLIDSEINHADDIITGITRLAKTKKPEQSKANINKFIKEYFSESPLPEHIKLLTKFDRESLDIMIDPLRFKQVFTNLASNAVRAMPEEGTLTVKARLVRREEIEVKSSESGVLSEEEKESEHNGDFVEISFSDTGCGIEKEVLGKIFEPFYTTRDTGMGLGMSIVKDIVELNGGNITVESEEEKGSTFKIVFPAINDL